MVKKILILYSKTGGGHFRAAESIAEELQAINKDYSIILYDGLVTTSYKKNIDPEKLFILLSTKLAFVYNLLYLLTDNSFGVEVLRHVIRSQWQKALSEYIAKESPDLIISTHPAASPSTITLNKFTGKFIAIVADLRSPHGLWIDSRADKIISPDYKTTERVIAKTGIAKDKIETISYPIRENFNNKSKNYKLTNTLLVLGGGAGSGKLEAQVKTLAQAFPDKKIIAVCGANQKLQDRLLKLNFPNVEVHGFTNEMPKLIQRSDIVISKSGPGTIMEAVASGKPLILTGWVIMQEKINIDFVLAQKLGIYAPKPHKLVSAVKEIYHDYPLYSNLDSEIETGSKKIAQFIHKLSN